MLPKLYKNTNIGLEEWSVRVENRPNQSDIIVSWGKVGGKIQEKTTTITEGKNIGKSNETTFEEQALSEAKSKWTKQLDKGYSEDKGAAKIIRPMLAHKYQDHASKLKFPCYIQPKSDGSRCLAFIFRNKVQLKSRMGKLILTMPHIEEELLDLYEGKDMIVDGELYIHGKNFQDLISAIKRDKANSFSKQIQYHTYDCFKDGDKTSFWYRYDWLRGRDKVVVVDTFECLDNNDITEYHQLFLSKGYEGSILRNNAPYEPDKRSFNLLKLKEFVDDEFKILDGEPDKNGHCVFTCELPDKRTFNVKPEGTDLQRKEYLVRLKDCIGKKLTVRFFEYTKDGMPRFPVGVCVRDYE